MVSHAHEGSSRKKPLDLVALALFLVLVPESSPAQTTNTDNTLYIGSPTIDYLATPSIVVNLQNTAATAFNVDLWVEVENYAGQTIRVFTDSVLIQEYDDITMADVLANLPQGNYTAVVSATTFSGIVVSKVESASFRA